MPRSGLPVCTACGVTLPGAFDAVRCCMTCRKAPPAFEMARAPWQYTGRMPEAVQQFKYHRRWRIGRWLADAMAATAHTRLPLHDVDGVVPIPLHWLKRRLKGFDPVEQLAAGVARRLDKPLLSRVLRRTRWTATQAHLRGRARWRNVEGAFAAQAPSVGGRTLLLVDDVLTSGATAEACVLALKTAGARRVLVLAAARTPLAPR